jgi:hypothetical protein
MNVEEERAYALARWRSRLLMLLIINSCLLVAVEQAKRTTNVSVIVIKALVGPLFIPAVVFTLTWLGTRSNKSLKYKAGFWAAVFVTVGALGQLMIAYR